MKNASRVLIFAFAVMMLSSAASVDAQTGTSSPAPVSGSAPAATNGTTSNGNSTAPTRHGPCKPDVQNFCSSVPKGDGRILACLKAHVGQLSPRCEAAMKRHADQQTAPATPSAAAPSPSANNPTSGK